MISYNQFASALNCMATSDAVGDPFEFNPEPRPDLVLAYYEGAASLEITDDTQMALFGAEGLCQTVEGASYTAAVQEAYLRWYKTQSVVRRKPYLHTGLLSMPCMYRVKAPGSTCLRACNYLYRGEPVLNDSTGCGAVMRLLPFVLLTAKHGWGSAISTAIDCATITHQGEEIPEAVSLYMHAAETSGRGAVLSYPFVHHFCIEDLGEGWTSLSCLKMAIWAVANSTSYEEMLTRAICHAGDSDSVAAVAGSLWGLSHNFKPTGRLVEQVAVDYVLKIVKEKFYDQEIR